MNNISSESRSKSLGGQLDSGKVKNLNNKSMMSARNLPERQIELQNSTAEDALVKIPDKIKDFARIKRAVDLSPEINQSEKIKNLKSQIQNGTYEVDYDALAQKMLEHEF